MTFPRRKAGLEGSDTSASPVGLHLPGEPVDIPAGSETNPQAVETTMDSMGLTDHVAAESLADLARAPEGLPPHTRGGPPRVMVVDDDQGFREMVRDWLGDEGMPVVAEAADGARAVDLARESSPDVILIDLRMPQLNGIEAVRQIKGFLPATQVIMLSGFGDIALQQAAEAVGVDSYLEKGCSPELLWRTIRFAGTYKLGLQQELEEQLPSPSR